MSYEEFIVETAVVLAAAARSDTARQYAYAFFFDRDGWTKCCCTAICYLASSVLGRDSHPESDIAMALQA